MLPSSGGEYAYVLHAFGGPVAFVTLWVNIVVVRPAAQAVVALACAEYSVALWFSTCQPPRIAISLLAAATLGKKHPFISSQFMSGYMNGRPCIFHS